MQNSGKTNIQFSRTGGHGSGDEIKKAAERNNRRKRKIKNSDIINPIFDQCAEVIEDKYWKDIFASASKGIFPRSFTYNNNYLIYHYGNQKTRVEVPENVREAISVCITFFQAEAGLYSNSDMDEMTQYSLTEEIAKEWKDIKSVKIREFLIDRYLERVAKKYQISSETKKQLETLVYMALLHKDLDKSHIVYQNGMVVCIQGLQYNVELGTFELDPSLIKRKRGETSRKLEQSDDDDDEEEVENVNHKISLEKKWEKFIVNFGKNCQRNIKPKVHIINFPENSTQNPTRHWSPNDDVSETSVNTLSS